MGLLNNAVFRAHKSPRNPWHQNARECSKKSVQQGRSRFDARSVRLVREHGKTARTPLAAFFNIPLMSDRFLVSLKGVLTPEERQFAKNPDGIEMVKRMRQNLISQGRDKRCKQISDITGTDVSGLFTDIEPQIGERVIMFTLAKDFDPHFR